MILNCTGQKPRQNKQIKSLWFIWHESSTDCRSEDNESPLTQTLIDEADMTDYIDSMNKSNIVLVSLQKIKDMPASY